jgi:uncharacterized protein (TIGR03435 family)
MRRRYGFKCYPSKVKYTEGVSKYMRPAIIFAFLSCAAWGQTTEGPDTFEVASIKPAAPQGQGRFMVGTRGGPGTPDPERLTLTNVSLKQILANAYDVKDYQIQGPTLLESERFDITAKIPKGSTKEQARIMMQNLLVERFKLTLHRDKKEFPMFGLVVGKNGPKMKRAEEPPVTETAGGDGPPPPLPQPGRLEMGKDGFPKLPPGGGRGGMMIMMMNGRFRMQANGQTMKGLADMLSNQLGRPVIDETKLDGKYEFTLDYAPEEGHMKGPMGMMPPPGHMEGPPGAIGAGPAPAGGGETGPNLVTAVQEQLGLKLESKKGPLDLIVVDHIEKTPTEN